MLEQPRINAALRALSRLESPVLTYQRVGRNGFVLYGVARTDDGHPDAQLKAVNVTSYVCLALGLPFDATTWTTNAFHPSAGHMAVLRDRTGIPWDLVGS